MTGCPRQQEQLHCVCFQQCWCDEVVSLSSMRIIPFVWWDNAEQPPVNMGSALPVCLLLQLRKLREQLVSLIQTEQQITHHKAALGSLYLNYQPSLDTTDFKSTLQQHMQLAEANSR